MYVCKRLFLVLVIDLCRLITKKNWDRICACITILTVFDQYRLKPLFQADFLGFERISKMMKNQ
jgi:hypothetical protein